MNREEEACLAWALADSTTEFLHPNARAWVCAKIGAGEKATAITDLLTCYASSDAELPDQLAARVHTWIRGYVGTEIEPVLRRLVGRIRVAGAVPRTAYRSAAACRRPQWPVRAIYGRSHVGTNHQ
jgi:hypothetical protein